MAKLHKPLLLRLVFGLCLIVTLASAEPRPAKNQLKQRKLSAGSIGAIAKLTKRAELCDSGYECLGTTTCCGQYCCYSTQLCTNTGLFTSFCYDYDDTGSTSTQNSSTTTTSNSKPSSRKNKSKGFGSWSTGAKVGVILGPIIFLFLVAGAIALCVLCGYCCCCRDRLKKTKNGDGITPGIYGAQAANVVNQEPKYDAVPPPQPMTQTGTYNPNTQPEYQQPQGQPTSYDPMQQQQSGHQQFQQPQQQYDSNQQGIVTPPSTSATPALPVPAYTPNPPPPANGMMYQPSPPPQQIYTPPAQFNSTVGGYMDPNEAKKTQMYDASGTGPVGR